MPGDPPDGIVLFPDALWSKWGNNDGDWPDEILDWGPDPEQPAPSWGKLTTPVDWSRALEILTERFVVPALGPGLAERVHITKNFGTNHNPCRVDTIDGMEVGEDWDTFGAPPAPLEGRFVAAGAVRIPRAEVVRAVEESGGWKVR